MQLQQTNSHYREHRSHVCVRTCMCISAMFLGSGGILQDQYHALSAIIPLSWSLFLAVMAITMHSIVVQVPVHLHASQVAKPSDKWNATQMVAVRLNKYTAGTRKKSMAPNAGENLWTEIAALEKWLQRNKQTNTTRNLRPAKQSIFSIKFHVQLQVL